MNNMDYLNQISGASNPQPQQKQSIGGLFSKKFIFTMGGLIAVAALLMILGSLLGKTGNKDKALMERINIRVSNLMSITQDYGRFTKSSNLRSMNASLYSVLNNTSVNFSPLAISKYELDPEKPSSTITTEEENTITELKANLDYGKLNGLLDRTYSREITLQIGLLMSLESEASTRTKDEEIKNVLAESYSNLSNLYAKFAEYSDASGNTRKETE